MITFMKVITVFTAAALVLMFALWLRAMKKTSTAAEKTKVKISSKRRSIYCIAWLVISFMNVMVKLHELVRELEHRDTIMEMDTSGMKIGDYPLGSGSDLTILGRIDRNILLYKLGVVFFLIVFAVFAADLLMLRSASVTSEGVFWGYRRYGREKLSYIMEEGMEQPVLVNSRSGSEFDITEVKDPAALRKILSGYYTVAGEKA